MQLRRFDGSTDWSAPAVSMAAPAVFVPPGSPLTRGLHRSARWADGELEDVGPVVVARGVEALPFLPEARRV